MPRGVRAGCHGGSDDECTRRRRRSPGTARGSGASDQGWADLLVTVSLDVGPSKTFLVEVLRRHSPNYGAALRVTPLLRHLADSSPTASKTTSRPAHRPNKLSHRLADETVAAILAEYQTGATTREVGKRFGLAPTSVNKPLSQHGVQARRRSPSANEVQRAVELYESGLSTRVIARHLWLRDQHDQPGTDLRRSCPAGPRSLKS